MKRRGKMKIKKICFMLSLMWLAGCGLDLGSTNTVPPTTYDKFTHQSCILKVEKLFQNKKKSIDRKKREFVQLCRKCDISRAINFPTGPYIEWLDGTSSGEWCEWCVWEVTDTEDDLDRKIKAYQEFYQQ